MSIGDKRKIKMKENKDLENKNINTAENQDVEEARNI